MKIKKQILKITSLLLVVGLNYSGLFGVGETMAYFTDTAIISGNTFTAGTLDFYLHSGQDNFVSKKKSEGIEPGDEVNRVIQVKQIFSINSLPFQYTVSFQKPVGDESFCKALQLKADLQGSEIYNGNLSGFNSDQIPYSLGSDTWHFKLSLPQDAGIEAQEKTCDFAFVFSGWQENISISGEGFSDVEEVFNSVESGEWEADPDDSTTNGEQFTLEIKTHLSAPGNISENIIFPAETDLQPVSECFPDRQENIRNGLQTRSGIQAEDESAVEEVEVEIEDTDEEEDIEVKEVVAEKNNPDNPDEDETEDTTEEDAKDEEVVLMPKKGISLDDDDDDDDTGEDDEKDIEGLGLEIEEEIKKINDDDNDLEDNGTKDNLNKNSVDCVQAVK